MTVGDVYRALWRHRFLIVLATVALLAIVWILTGRQAKLYTASTLVRVQQKITDQGEAFGALQTGERLARTYAIIAETKAVTGEIDSLLGGAVPDKELKVKAEQVDNLELLRLSVTNESPVMAARIANAVPDALSRFISGRGSLRDEIITVERASVPISPSSPNLKLSLAIALLMGLIVNGALALLVDALSDRVGDSEEIERTFGLPVITTFPKMKLRPRPRTPAARELAAAGTTPDAVLTGGGIGDR